MMKPLQDRQMSVTVWLPGLGKLTLPLHYSLFATTATSRGLVHTHALSLRGMLEEHSPNREAACSGAHGNVE